MAFRVVPFSEEVKGQWLGAREAISNEASMKKPRAYELYEATGVEVSYRRARKKKKAASSRLRKFLPESRLR
jgi:hypothetical protein